MKNSIAFVSASFLFLVAGSAIAAGDETGMGKDGNDGYRTTMSPSTTEPVVENECSWMESLVGLCEVEDTAD